MDFDSSLIYELNAHSFEYKSSGLSGFVFIAEDVFKLTPCMAVVNDDVPMGVQYSKLVAPIIEEMKKLKNNNIGKSPTIILIIIATNSYLCIGITI